MPFLFVLILSLSGCVHSFKKQKGKASPKIYFDKAVYYKEKTNYSKALENLNKLKQQFFYSSYNEKALLLTADIYFEQEKFPKATRSYEKHLNLYPNKKRDYVLYKIGLSYKNQLPDRAEHDLSLAEPALKAFSLLLKSKTKSPYKQKALIEKQKILDQKASKELKTALFFKTQGWNQAGLNRIEYFIKNYPKSPLMPKALLTGVQLADLLNKNSKSFKNKLIKNYPKSPEAKAVHKKRHSGFLKNLNKKLL